jgi:hypothetical protein
MSILECMCQRGMIFLAIMLSACVSMVAFLPAGPGPYTAVYGPASALRAQRAVLLLALAISFVSTVFLLLAALGSFELPSRAATGLEHQLYPAPTLSSSLRC